MALCEAQVLYGDWGHGTEAERQGLARGPTTRAVSSLPHNVNLVRPRQPLRLGLGSPFLHPDESPVSLKIGQQQTEPDQECLEILV